MGIFDLLKNRKKKKEEGNQANEQIIQEKNYTENTEDKKKADDIEKALAGVDTSSLPRMQRIALKMFQKMPRKKQEEIIQKAMNPQEIMKNKDKVLKQIDEMVKSGQMDKNQAEALKGQLGLK